jgi:hypothetical protein
VDFLNPLFLLVDLEVSMCDLKALFLLIFPDAVLRNVFAAPRLLFIFGI